jgi:predicted Zn-dependent peptidase
MNTDDLIHFTLREWTRMSMSPGTAEVERAKSQLKASLLLGLDGSTAIAEDVSWCRRRQEARCRLAMGCDRCRYGAWRLA